MNNILVLTDFSENSVNAYQYAVQLACQVKANILLVFSTNGQAISLTNRGQYAQKLHSFAKRYACASRLKVNPHHTECLISDEKWEAALPALIQQHAPDLVVAGSGLLTQLEKDQVTLPLQLMNNCPVLWVPEKTTYQPLKNLVFVTDFTDQEATVINQVRKLAEEFKASITLLHFYAPSERKQLAEIKKNAIALQATFAKGTTPYFLIEEEDMIEGLADFAEKHFVDLFLFATRDTHLAHHYFQPVYRKTNSCQMEIPLLNFYQQTLKPCAKSCIFCHTPKGAKTLI